ncbi:MAG TPA: alpha-glucan family phosphorylase [Candidatus Binataceae bacterium]|nr:alpha-glucan family phosphorylase [Candidatus Binataceae bacterium]
MPQAEESSIHGEKMIDLLRELALDLGLNWKRHADDIWREIDPEVWRVTRNPWLILQEAPANTIESMSNDSDIRGRVEQLVLARRESLSGMAWFQKTHADSALAKVAYLSMEFGLSEALPIYSGGLGNVAGDQLKAGSDLGVPIVGVGLLYQQGYFRQAIDHEGNQLDLFPYNPPSWLPIMPVRDSSGRLLTIGLDFPDYHLRLRVWEVKVGRLKLYLLDSNDPANLPAHRGVTSELYGGGPELRLQQELVLGIAGWRLLKQLGLNPQVCHLNEGHAAFAVLERARWFMEENDKPFGAALAATRAGNVFTTHTPVAAGFDRFSPTLMKLYLNWYANERLHISFEDLMALGRPVSSDPGEPFNMAHLALRAAGAINGVSKLHGIVSRSIFLPLFPRWPMEDVPIGSVTNGVHTGSWDSAASDQLWSEVCGKDRWLGTNDGIGGRIRSIPDDILWKLRNDNSEELVRFVRLRTQRVIASYGAPQEDIEEAKTIFDSNALTLGFARRFATYKRPNMLLHDPERLTRILTNEKLPVQLVIAGKAHPADQAGKHMVHEWIEFIRRRNIRRHAVFLIDYDMLLAERIVEGVDVWINTPRRPWEASGTSGMKVLVNGGLNFSELDGWWAEAYAPEVGWKIGDGKEHGDDPAWDTAEAEQLYDILENEVIARFYERDAAGLPRKWIAMMRESMARLTPEFSANRTVREYTEKYYLPAAAEYRRREASRGAVAQQISQWHDAIAKHWPKVRFGRAYSDTIGDFHNFRVEVYLDQLQPDSVLVELYAQAHDGGPCVKQPMVRGEELNGSAGGFIFTAQVPSSRPAADYTPRITPAYPGVQVPLEVQQILWQH